MKRDLPVHTVMCVYGKRCNSSGHSLALFEGISYVVQTKNEKSSTAQNPKVPPGVLRRTNIGPSWEDDSVLCSCAGMFFLGIKHIFNMKIVPA